MKKILTCFFLFLSVFLMGCSGSGSDGDVSSLPSLFSIVPDGYDQLLHITVDDGVIDILANQYGEGTPVVEEFEKIEELLIRQKDSETTGQTMMFVKGDGVNLEQLAVLGLVGGDDSYGVTSLSDTVQVYGQKDHLASAVFDGVTPNQLMKQTIRLIDPSSNFVFVSRPTELQLPGFAGQFSQQLKGTTGAFSIGTSMPTGEATMVFEPGVVPKFAGTWKARSGAEGSPIHIATHDLFALLKIPKTLLETLLPVFAQQYVGESLSLLNPDDYSIIFESLGGEISLDLLPSALGMGGRLTVENEKLYDIFAKMQPALDGYFKAELFSGGNVRYDSLPDVMSWSSEIPAGVGPEGLGEIPLVGIGKVVADATEKVTQIEFMAMENAGMGVNRVRKEYPGSTFLVADIDFELLSSLVGADMEMLAGDGKNNLHLELTAEHKDNIVRLTVN